MLHVGDYGLGADSPHLVCLVGVADQGDGLVAALWQDLGQAQGDLAVPRSWPTLSTALGAGPKTASLKSVAVGVPPKAGGGAGAVRPTDARNMSTGVCFPV